MPARVNAAHSVAAAWLSRVAQKKVSVISSWTRDALAAKQTRGYQLGTPANLPDEAKLKGRAARQTNAQTMPTTTRPRSWPRYGGLTGSIYEHAEQLHRSGDTTRRRRAFTPGAFSAY